ncbi:probable insulin-like peptide 6 isoform X2 [Drosophila ficusphila]|uniref:probable insulin-like peptide 6 isoform X2 n=1 Tax=Drosophila ficusphila TaxID=30025 RepID=UPI0007E5E88B|nr:probable insulin-like peptide 6 isoform X2 [Drosophila ficusphila]
MYIAQQTYISKTSSIIYRGPRRKPVHTIQAQKEEHANMIPEVPTSRILLVLTTLVAVVTLISSWVPQVAGSPLPPVEFEHRRTVCSTELTDLIQRICASGTLSHGDIYQNSFGKRRKRDSLNVADRCCRSGGCTFSELLKYCRD